MSVERLSEDESGETRLMNWHLFSAFLVITVVLFLTPGPIVTLVVTTGATQRRARGADDGRRRHHRQCRAARRASRFGLSWVSKTSRGNLRERCAGPARPI